ncbi:hypothetical protein EAI_01056 [Harpegnathos saltator]|uniref:Uncharacterized protein n=1 Tax=Harpegnathos saltator TaxID=610380 RepID=E2BL90_HARSA|nr:hypothetical protein EAI_01056 [Harpegnathos saltator]
MIKFRKGSRDLVAGATSTPSTLSGSSPMQRGTGGAATGPGVTVLPTIEDIYLPPRYQRRPLGDKEIEYINVSYN